MASTSALSAGTRFASAVMRAKSCVMACTCPDRCRPWRRTWPAWPQTRNGFRRWGLMLRPWNKSCSVQGSGCVSILRQCCGLCFILWSTFLSYTLWCTECWILCWRNFIQCIILLFKSMVWTVDMLRVYCDAELMLILVLLLLFLITSWLLGLPLSMRRRDLQKTMNMVKWWRRNWLRWLGRWRSFVRRLPMQRKEHGLL